MPRKPIELPPKVAKAFLADMRTFFAEKNTIRADGIAAQQHRRHAQFMSKKNKRLARNSKHASGLRINDRLEDGVFGATPSSASRPLASIHPPR